MGCPTVWREWSSCKVEDDVAMDGAPAPPAPHKDYLVRGVDGTWQEYTLEEVIQTTSVTKENLIINLGGGTIRTVAAALTAGKERERYIFRGGAQPLLKLVETAPDNGEEAKRVEAFNGDVMSATEMNEQGCTSLKDVLAKAAAKAVGASGTGKREEIEPKKQESPAAAPVSPAESTEAGGDTTGRDVSGRAHESGAGGSGAADGASSDDSGSEGGGEGHWRRQGEKHHGNGSHGRDRDSSRERGRGQNKRARTNVRGFFKVKQGPGAPDCVLASYYRSDHTGEDGRKYLSSHQQFFCAKAKAGGGDKADTLIKNIRKESDPQKMKAWTYEPHMVLRGAPKRDWERYKVTAMREAVRSKYKVPTLRAALLATGDAYLEERNGNETPDPETGRCFWGSGSWSARGNGLNMNGHILMDERDAIREEMRREEAAS